MLNRSHFNLWCLNRSTSLDRRDVKHTQVYVFSKVALNRFPPGIVCGIIKLSRGVDPSLSTTIHLGTDRAVEVLRS
jgi:hypothetical protein